MRRLFATAAAALVFAACTAAGVDRGANPAVKGPSPRAYAHAVVSVRDMREALDLWERQFGMEVSRRAGGPDELARVWGLPESAILEQALLNTPGMIDGGVHLVRFARPGEVVREAAAPNDLAPRGFDIAVRYIEARRAQLAAAGHDVGQKVAGLQSDGATTSEVRMAADEGLELRLVEQPGKPEVVSPKGFGVAAHLVLVTPDNEREAAFFRDVLGLEELAHERLAGPEAEQALGLPAGTALDVRILGAKDSRFGRLKLVQYEGAEGRDLYARAAPPALGLLSVTYVVPDIAPILARGRSAGIADHGIVRSILGQGPMASVTSPAGLRVDIIQL